MAVFPISVHTEVAYLTYIHCKSLIAILEQQRSFLSRNCNLQKKHICCYLIDCNICNMLDLCHDAVVYFRFELLLVCMYY